MVMPMKTMTQDEFLAEAKNRFGEKARNWKFVCPMCGTVQSVQQLLDAVVASGGGVVKSKCMGRDRAMRWIVKGLSR